MVMRVTYLKEESAGWAHLEQRPVHNDKVADYVDRKRVVELAIPAYPRDGSDLQR